MNTMQEPQNAGPTQLRFHLPVPWVYVLTYLAGAGLEWFLPLGSRFLQGRWVSWVGLVLFVAGAILAAWGWLTFFKAGTTTIPGRASTALVNWGPYRFTRNPMYVGLGVAYLGEAGLLHQLWPVLLLPLTFAYVNWMVIPVEEARLTEVFGRKYELYRATVRRWF